VTKTVKSSVERKKVSTIHNRTVNFDRMVC